MAERHLPPAARLLSDGSGPVKRALSVSFSRAYLGVFTSTWSSDDNRLPLEFREHRMPRRSPPFHCANQSISRTLWDAPEGTPASRTRRQAWNFAGSCYTTSASGKECPTLRELLSWWFDTSGIGGIGDIGDLGLQLGLLSHDRASFSSVPSPGSVDVPACCRSAAAGPVAGRAQGLAVSIAQLHQASVSADA